MEKSLNKKYILIQVLFYSTYCMLLGFSSNYFKGIGIEAGLIGMILSLGNLASTLIQPPLAALVDKKHIPIGSLLITLMGISSIAALVLYLFHQIYILAAFLFILIIALVHGFIPLANSLAFSYQKQNIHLSFGLARGAGSFSYAITSLLLGYIIQLTDVRYLPLYYMMIFLTIIPVIKSFTIKIDNPEKKELKKVNFFSKYHYFMIFLIGFILVFIPHIIINNFMIYEIDYLHGTSSQMGQAVFIAAFVELPAMSLFERISKTIKITALLKISAVMFTVKHILTFFASSITVLYLAQFLQIFAYALFIPASVYYVNALFDKEDTTQGQSLVPTATTVAGTIASLSGGFMIQKLNIHTTLMIGMILSIIGTIIMIMNIRERA